MSKNPPSTPSSADPADLDLESFANAVAAGEAAVVDVREPHEFAAGHIPGAVMGTPRRPQALWRSKSRQQGEVGVQPTPNQSQLGNIAW